MRGTEKQVKFEEVFLAWKECGANEYAKKCRLGCSYSDRSVSSPISRVHVFFSFSVFFSSLVFVSVCMCVSLHMPQPKRASQRTMYGSQFSPSTMRVPRTEFGLPGLKAKCFLSAEPFCQL